MYCQLYKNGLFLPSHSCDCLQVDTAWELAWGPGTPIVAIGPSILPEIEWQLGTPTFVYNAQFTLIHSHYYNYEIAANQWTWRNDSMLHISCL